MQKNKNATVRAIAYMFANEGMLRVVQPAQEIPRKLKRDWNTRTPLRPPMQSQVVAV